MFVPRVVNYLIMCNTTKMGIHIPSGKGLYCNEGCDDRVFEGTSVFCMVIVCVCVFVWYLKKNKRAGCIKILVQLFSCMNSNVSLIGASLLFKPVKSQLLHLPLKHEMIRLMKG